MMTLKAMHTNTKMVFAQSSKDVKSDRYLSHITCSHYGSKSQHAKDCSKQENYMLTTVMCDENDDTEVEEHIFHQVGSNILSRDLLLLDNHNTVDQFVNSKYLTNISNVDQQITVYCNTRSKATN